MVIRFLKKSTFPWDVKPAGQFHIATLYFITNFHLPYCHMYPDITHLILLYNLYDTVYNLYDAVYFPIFCTISLSPLSIPGHLFGINRKDRQKLQVLEEI